MDISGLEVNVCSLSEGFQDKQKRVTVSSAVGSVRDRILV
jgi:hypothetical protein